MTSELVYVIGYLMLLAHRRCKSRELYLGQILEMGSWEGRKERTQNTKWKNARRTLLVVFIYRLKQRFDNLGQKYKNQLPTFPP